MLVENQKVLLKKDKCYRIVNINNKVIDLDRVKFSLSGLIGHTFGSIFSVENGNLVKIVDKTAFDNYEKLKVESLSENTDRNVNVGRDNRDLSLNAKNQLLSAAEIESLKKSGETGAGILEKLVENSQSFNKKTTFAQEKYLLKKKKRYMPIVSVHRITTRMLCELYCQRSKLKIMNLRIDTVSQILSYSNVHHGARVLLAETCAGLLLGSLVQRGAFVINFYHGSAPTLPESHENWYELNGIVYNIPLAQMVPLATTGEFVKHVSNRAVESKEQLKEICDDNMNIEGCENWEEKEENDVERVDNETLMESDVKKESGTKRPLQDSMTDSNGKKKFKMCPITIETKRNEVDKRREEARKFLLSDNGTIDSLVIAVKFEPVQLTLNMLRFLSPGKPFVVYSQFIQPLVDIYDAVRKNVPTSSLKVTESWLRDYQVLPERTHPEMSTSGTGGYLLTGIKLESF